MPETAEERQKRRERNMVRLWCAPKIWLNNECFILGGGPSLKHIDVGRLKGKRVIAVNNAYLLGEWIDVCFFNDMGWFRMHKTGLLGFAGLKVTTNIKCRNEPGIRVMCKRTSPYGIATDPGILSWNKSSGACAINLAVHFGVRRIVLLGFDMQRVGDEANWHRDHPNADRKKDPYAMFRRPFPYIGKALKRLNIECVNATLGSALTEFPIVDPEDVLP
jgi:hypothetical protein